MQRRALAFVSIALLVRTTVSSAQQSDAENSTETNLPFRCSVMSNRTTVTTRYRQWSQGIGFVDKSQSASNGVWRLTFQVVYTQPTGHPEDREA